LPALLERNKQTNKNNNKNRRLGKRWSHYSVFRLLFIPSFRMASHACPHSAWPAVLDLNQIIKLSLFLVKSLKETVVIKKKRKILRYNFKCQTFRKP